MNYNMEVKEYKDKNIREIYTKNDTYTLERCPFNDNHPLLRSYDCFKFCHKRISIDYTDLKNHDYKTCVITCKIND